MLREFEVVLLCYLKTVEGFGIVFVGEKKKGGRGIIINFIFIEGRIRMKWEYLGRKI